LKEEQKIIKSSESKSWIKTWHKILVGLVFLLLIVGVTLFILYLRGIIFQPSNQSQHIEIFDPKYEEQKELVLAG
jgi:hypothetical protein